MVTKIFLIIIATINSQERDSFEYYKTEINRQYESVGATVVKRYPVLQVLAGEEKPDFIMIVEFPNQQALQKLFTSEEYKKIAPYREKGFTKLNAMISVEQ